MIFNFKVGYLKKKKKKSFIFVFTHAAKIQQELCMREVRAAIKNSPFTGVRKTN